MLNVFRAKEVLNRNTVEFAMDEEDEKAASFLRRQDCSDMMNNWRKEARHETMTARTARALISNNCKIRR